MTEVPSPPAEAPPAPLEGLPKDALRRLAELQGKDALFTSDLSVNEFLLVKEAGFHPRGLVVGSSIYHIGFSAKGWSTSREVQNLTQAMYAARELAMSRMEEEAAVLGADGILGVRLDVGFYEWGRGTAEFIAIGTAVSAEDGGNWKTPEGKPFTSDLSGQDFWTLLQSGHAPISLVLGTCVYHVAHQGMFKAMGNIGQNKEMPNFTQALYEARELAMERMQDEARKVSAEGIVGVQIQEKSHVWGSHTIEFFAVGTAVRRLPDRQITTPRMVLSLDR
ncbi:MAG: heavy metal-binding domain-containing protein [Candidatus Dormiibacterota bacterium]